MDPDLHKLAAGRSPIGPEQARTEAKLIGPTANPTVDLARAFLEEAGTSIAHCSIPSVAAKAGEVTAFLSQALAAQPIEWIQQNFPSPKLRPVLLTAMIEELVQAGITPQTLNEEALATSRIAGILKYPHQRLIGEEWERLIERLPSTLPPGGFFAHWVEGEKVPALNGSMRNILLAEAISRSSLFRDSTEVRLLPASYTWKQYRDYCYGDVGPEIPAASQLKLKLNVGFFEKSGKMVEVADYTIQEHNLGKNATGEGYGHIIGDPKPSSPTPNGSETAVIQTLLRQIARSQSAELDRVVISVFQHFETLVTLLDHFLHRLPRDPYPDHLLDLSELSDGHLETLLQVADTLQKSHALLGGRLSPCRFLDGEKVRVEFYQPSTRTEDAAAEALRMHGAAGEIHHMGTSSAKMKAESVPSHISTVAADGYKLMMVRGSEIKPLSEELQTRNRLTVPSLLSLGGDRGHPTQTAAEWLALMRNFRVESLTFQELRERYQERPLVLTVIGHTAQKRADLAFIRETLQRFPNAEVQIFVPHERYRPDKGYEEPYEKITRNLRSLLGFSFGGQPLPPPEPPLVADGGRVHVYVDKKLRDPEHVMSILNGDVESAGIKGADIVYSSNPAKTRSGGPPVGKVDYMIPDQIRGKTTVVMAPLPSSIGDLGTGILRSPTSNILVEPVVQNKKYIIAAALLLSWKARGNDFSLLSRSG